MFKFKLSKIILAVILLIPEVTLAGEFYEAIIKNDTDEAFAYYSDSWTMPHYVPKHSRRIMVFDDRFTWYRVEYFLNPTNFIYCQVTYNPEGYPPLRVDITTVNGNVPYTCKLSPTTEGGYPVIIVTAK